MHHFDKEIIKNTFGFLVPLSIIIIAITATAAVFFIGIQDYQARENTKAVIIPLDNQLQEINHDKRLISSLPVNNPAGPVNEAVAVSNKSESELSEILIEELVSRIPVANSTSTVDRVLLDVPFTPQAPFGEWDDPRQDYGCEEASLLMVWYYIKQEPLSYSQAKNQIIAISDWELEVYGEFRDSSASHTVDVFKDYFAYENVKLVYDASIEDIKSELRAGNPAIVPLDGQIIDNPYYTPPGPLHHMLVVVGYDENTGEFITNDPGTKRGRQFRYNYDNFYDSIRDYESGHAEPVTEIRRPMIVIR